MKKVPAVLVMALIALPMFAAPKPTPTPKSSTVIKGIKAQESARKTQGKQPTVEIKEGAPATPSPTEEPSGSKVSMQDFHFTKRGKATPTPTPNAQRMHPDMMTGTSHKEGAPGTPTPTAGPAEVNQIKSTKSNASEKKIGEPVRTTTINTSKSNNLKEGAPGTPSPTAGPVAGTTINTSKSNTYREGQPKYVAARVLSQQGRRLTVQLSDGKAVAVDGSSLNPIPKVGSTVNITNSGGHWVIVLR